MSDARIYIGGIAAVLSLTAYIPYLKDIVSRKTKPHIFSWFIWATLMWIGFLAQMARDAGPGAWVTAAEAMACLVVFFFSFSHGEKEITRSDWISFCGALLGIMLWLTTHNPLWAVILVTVVDALGFFPTFRKAFTKPREETVISYFIIALSFCIGLFALSSYSFTTVLYPAYLVVANGLFWVYIIVRRSQVKTA